MFRRPWIIATAIGLVALSGQAQQQAGDEQRQTEAEQAPPQPDVSPLPIKIIEDEATADARQRREQEARQREIDDLIAQQGMNEATRAMNSATQEMRDYAYAQTWLVGVGTILLVGTLFLTIRATKAATDAVEVTRNIGKKQLRAYLIASEAGFEFLEAETGVILQAHIYNTGLTPARNARIMGQSFFGPYPSDDLPPHPDVLNTHGTPIGAGGSLMSAMRLMGPDFDEAFASVRAGTHGMWIQGTCRYEDIFGDSHITKFRFVFGGRLAGEGIQMHADAGGNEAD